MSDNRTREDRLGHEAELRSLLRELNATQQRIAELTGEVGAAAVVSPDSAPHAANDDAQLRGAILDTLSAHIALLDREGRIVTTNRAWHRFARENGLDHAAHGVGSNYLAVCDSATGPYSDEAVDAAAGIRAVLAGERESFELEYPCNAPDQERWFRLVVNPIGEGHEGVVVMHLDITAHRALEQQLVQAQRLESVGQLTGGVAHDFNNLLTVIMGNAELLAESLGDDRERMARTIVDAARSGAELTQNLLAFARRQVLVPRRLSLNELLLGMNELLSRVLGEQVRIELRPGDNLPDVLVDPAGLENSLLNLCLNARDAMPGGGDLVISSGVRRLTAGEVPEADGVEPGRYVALSVRDTGVGMDAKARARAFDPFYTTKPVGKGTGLGLSMVYGFVRQSSGHVTLESRPGEGTEVTLYLPVADSHERSTGGSHAGSDDRIPTGRGETVLVVEDQDALRDYVCTQLDALGYRVLAARNAAAALALLRSGEAVDLLFTDVVMPGGTGGGQLADQARAQRPGLRVLFTSGYSDTWVMPREGLETEAPLLSKPYRRAQLAQAVFDALRREAD